MQKKKVGIVGCGHLGSIIAGAFRDGLLPDYELCGYLSRTREKAEKLAADCGGKVCTDLKDLLSLKPDFIAEAASVEAVRQIAVPVLSSGADLILLSIGALSDDSFYAGVLDTAAENGTKIYPASGAVGGFDVLRTVALMSRVSGKELSSCIHTQKGPESLRNTVLFRDALLKPGTECDVFSGNAREAIRLLPTKVNVAVAAALATAGPGKTRVQITSTEGFKGDDHCITAQTDGVKATVDIFSSTGDIAAFSVISLLQNLASPIVF